MDLGNKGYATIVHGEYVFTPCQNVNNSKISYWLSKEGLTAAMYCFSVLDPGELREQNKLKVLDSYISCFKSRFEEKKENWAVIAYWVGESGESEVYVFDSEKDAIEKMQKLWEKSYNLALEDETFDEMRTYHEEYIARVAWNDELYRIFEVQKVYDKEDAA